MERTILHSDINSCYASIELLYHPELRGKPMAVGGDPEARHGIVLAKEPLAKRAGVKTGMALWQARQLCPEIIFLPPRFDLYLRFSRMAHDIYRDYTDQQEAFGIDECWLDVTNSAAVKGDGPAIAEEIRERMKRELGITVSIGVSWNKIFAKLGSDYRKPDAITVIGREEYGRIICPLPVEDLLYVGPATKEKLYNYGIDTIGKLAVTDPHILKGLLGKMGLVLQVFARGEDRTPVSREGEVPDVKSIGNSTTLPRDLKTDEEVAIVFYVLAESVAARLREQDFQCRTIEINLRDNRLGSLTRQRRLALPTDITGEIAEAAIGLFKDRYDWQLPLRSVGLKAGSLIGKHYPVQLDLFLDQERRDKWSKMDTTVDEIRRRFGYHSLERGIMQLDKELSALDAKTENVIHPHGYMERGNHTGA